MTDDTSHPDARPALAGFGRTTPAEIVRSREMDRDAKIELLRQWELDLREEMVAQEENMATARAPDVSLDEVLDALRALGAGAGAHGPDKHG